MARPVHLEFDRLSNIELKSLDKVPLSAKDYMPYLPQRMQKESPEKIMHYISRLGKPIYSASLDPKLNTQPISVQITKPKQSQISKSNIEKFVRE